MKAKYILEAIAKLREADKKIKYLVSQISPHQTGHLLLSEECRHIADMLELESGLQSVEVSIEPPTSLREQFDRESA